MSQKSGKKVKRRIEEEPEIPVKDFVVEKNQRKESEVADESEVKKHELNGKDESVASNTRSHSSPQNKKDISLDLKADLETENVKVDTVQEETLVKHDIESKKDATDDQPEAEKQEEFKTVEVETVVVEKTVVIEIEDACQTPTDGSNPPTLIEYEKVEESIEVLKTTECESIELEEPLIIENEEPDPELQFDENSDVDSRKSSPIIRCRTRRSLTRNIPTPKTPKSFLDTNGEDTQGSDKPPTSEDETAGNEIKGSVSKLCESFESINNISTKAVAGSDITRNIEINCSSFQDHEFSPFLNVSKDRSVGETLRHLTSRRAIRPVKDYQKLLLQANQEKKSKKKAATLAPPLPPGRPSVERISGLKRKSHSQTPDTMKRFKPNSPGLFSYISSPIQSIKNHFVKSEIPSSTPKLTGYKTKTTFDNSDVSKICLDLTPVDDAEKRWCSIM